MLQMHEARTPCYMIPSSKTSNNIYFASIGLCKLKLVLKPTSGYIYNVTLFYERVLEIAWNEGLYVMYPIKVIYVHNYKLPKTTIYFSDANRKINIFMQNKPQQRNPWNSGYRENQWEEDY